MTRWVRAGNTQKHQKMPGDATKWGEFDHQEANKSSPKKKKVKNGPKAKQNNKSPSVSPNFSGNVHSDSTVIDEQFSKRKNSTSFKVEKIERKNELESCITDGANCTKISSNVVASNVTQGDDPDKLSRIPDSCPEKTLEVQNVIPLKKRKKNKKNIKDVKNNSEVLAEQTSPKVFEKKKEIYLKKLQERRAKNGITLLPSKVERKLYMIKKKLRDKGLPSHILKEIIRKERRKEELKFRKTFNPHKLCFHCRKPGHMFAECPHKVGSSNQATGMCFKCGSYEHTSFKCPENVQGFPYAKCFICKEQGHISKDCPKNKHGIYPRGGRCDLCGNMNHLKKDCPSLCKKEKDEPTITLHTIKEVTSIDEEVIEKKERKKESVKKPKLVVF